jgi:hypothetical protein
MDERLIYGTAMSHTQVYDYLERAQQISQISRRKLRRRRTASDMEYYADTEDTKILAPRTASIPSGWCVPVLKQNVLPCDEALADVYPKGIYCDEIETPIIHETDTFIVLDYDDTLCPSHDMMESLVFENAILTDEDRALLAAHDTAAENFLMKCLSHGDVYVITNAEMGWVKRCLAYTPKLGSLLLPIPEGLTFVGKSILRLISARDPAEKQHRWKLAAYRKSLPLRAKQVIGVGDALNDRDSIFRFANENMIRCKSIKFHDKPSIEQLTWQLTSLADVFDVIMEHGDTIDIALQLPASLSTMGSEFTGST